MHELIIASNALKKLSSEPVVSWISVLYVFLCTVKAGVYAAQPLAPRVATTSLTPCPGSSAAPSAMSSFSERSVSSASETFIISAFPTRLLMAAIPSAREPQRGGRQLGS